MIKICPDYLSYKKANRIISHAGYRAHTQPIFSRLKILNINVSLPVGNLYVFKLPSIAPCITFK